MANQTQSQPGTKFAKVWGLKLVVPRSWELLFWKDALSLHIETQKPYMLGIFLGLAFLKTALYQVKDDLDFKNIIQLLDYNLCSLRSFQFLQTAPGRSLTSYV